MSDADDDPPLPKDHLGWQDIVKAGELRRFPNASIVAAIQTYHGRTDVDQHLVEVMSDYISDRMLEILRGAVSTKAFPDEGWSIVEAAHEKMLAALFRPASSDGEGLRTRFKGLLVNRATDQVRKAMLEKKRYAHAEDPGVLPAAKIELFSAIEQELHVKMLLDRLRDQRKRAAFELHMNGVPYGGNKADSIAGILGISAETAAAWVDDAKAQLAKMIGKR